MAEPAPFHRLLSFYSSRTPHPTPQTIRLHDSLTGNLALGLNFPVALAIAIGRHLYLRNTGSFFSFNIHVPSVPTKHTFLDGIPVDEKKGYSAAEMWKLGGQNGWSGAIDAVGVWSLAADRDTGLVGGRDVVGFQEGVLCDRLEARRKGTGDVLPFLRGGPGWVAGHSWMVRTMFGVRVYEEGRKVD